MSQDYSYVIRSCGFSLFTPDGQIHVRIGPCLIHGVRNLICSFFVCVSGFTGPHSGSDPSLLVS